MLHLPPCATAEIAIAKRGIMKSLLSACFALLMASCVAACSVYMEATRPTPVDLNDFPVGTPRDTVMDKLGAPDSTALESDETSCDYYKLYTRGYGAGGKIPIAVAEGAADFFHTRPCGGRSDPDRGRDQDRNTRSTSATAVSSSCELPGASPASPPLPLFNRERLLQFTAASSATSGAEAGTTSSSSATPSPTGEPVASNTPGPSPSLEATPTPTPQPSPSIGAPQG